MAEHSGDDSAVKHLKAALSNAEQALEEAQQRVREAHRVLEERQAEVDQLGEEVRGLRLHLQRRAEDEGGGQAAFRVETSPGSGKGAAIRRIPSPEAVIRRMTLTRAVEQVLRMQKGDPLGPQDIVDRLEEYGRLDEDRNTVSTILSRLRDRGKAANVGHGAWVHAEFAPEDERPTSDEEGVES